MSGRGLALVGSVVAMLVAMSGCSSPGSESPPAQASIKVGAARPSNKKILVLAPVGCFDRCATEYTRAAQWPDACKLIDDGDIRAVLPQATNISMKPEDQTITVGQRNQLHGSPLGVATRSACLIRLALPDGMDGTIWIKDVAVGGLEAVQRNYQGDVEGARSLSSVALRTDLGATECFTSDVAPAAGPHTPDPAAYDNAWHLNPEWRCYRGTRYAAMEYSVSGPELTTGTGRATFTRAGKARVATDVTSARALLADLVTAELAKSVTAALS
jgi:hypothetical protein